jgi:MFS-type transporter involved in bile tolerance (Atg22 family)
LTIGPPAEPPPDERAHPGWFGRIAVDIGPLRDSKEFRRLWFGQAISYLGSTISLVAIPFQVYELTGSTLAVGLLGLAALVPLLTVPLIGGAIADAVDRRRVLLFAEIGLVAVTAANLVNALLPEPHVWVPFAVTVVGTAFYSLARPASDALMPRLVGEDRIPAAAALQGVYSSFGAVAGPALGGILIAAIGIEGAYAVDLASYSAALVAVWLLPRLMPVGEITGPGLRSILEGLRYVSRSRVLLGVFVIDSIAMVFGMPSALFPALGDELGGGARTVGFLYAAPYAGALVASLRSGLTTSARRQGLGVTVAVVAWGVAIGAVGLFDSLVLALVFLAVAGAADFVSAVLRNAILLSATPDSMRGRISGIEYAQVAGTPQLGNLEAGVVASLAGVRASIASGGIACVAGALLLTALLPDLIRYRAR